MLTVRRAPASSHLRPVVSGFTERKGHFREMSLMRPLPARPEQILEIYLAECYRVKRTDAGFGLSPDAAVVGPMTQPRVELGFIGEIETFTIHFQPTGLSRLFGIPMNTLADDAAAVSDVLGVPGRNLVDRVRSAPSFAQRVEIAEAWTRQALADARAINAVDHVASLLAAELAIARGDRALNAGRLDEAEASSRRSLELRRATLGDDDPNTLSSLRGLAGIRGTQRAHADAAALYRDYVTRASLVLGPASVQVQRARLPLARKLWRAGRQAEAEAALDEAEAFLPEMHDPEAFRAQVARARATIAGDPSVFD